MLEKVLKGRVQYVVPSFQQPYRWKENRWATFFNGVMDTFHKDSGHELFLGAIVIMPIQSTLSGLHKYLLVDGMQRLITVLALIAAIRDLIQETDRRLYNMINRHYLLNEREEGSYHYRLLPSTRDRSRFFRTLGEGIGDDAKSFEAARFFLDELLDRPRLDAHALLHFLLQHFMVVRIELEKDENPYPIFKSLNLAEMPASPSELDEYSKFESDPRLMALIASGESEQLEFKEGLMGRRSDQRLTEKRTNSVVRTVAAFMNSTTGGTILIGVRDDGSIRGVNRDFRRIDKGKANWDGFVLHIRNTLRSRLDIENPFRFYQIVRHRLKGRDVCRIQVTPADAPVYVDKRLYVRSGNQSLEMQGPDLVAYVENRWGK